MSRLLIVGGAGTLFVAPSVRLVDTDHLPPESPKISSRPYHRWIADVRKLHYIARIITYIDIKKRQAPGWIRGF